MNNIIQSFNTIKIPKNKHVYIADNQLLIIFKKTNLKVGITNF